MTVGKPAWSAGARQGPLRRHKDLVFFACEGFVALYDERTPEEDYQVINARDFEHRANELAKLAKKMRVDDRKWMRQEGNELFADCVGMKDTVREARDMGDPTDPAVQAFWARHRRRTTVSLSAGSDAAGYPTLPDVDLGPNTGKQVSVDGVAAVPDNHRIRKKPKKKPRNGLVLGDML